MKKIGKLILFLCYVFSLSAGCANANTDTFNWCGQYFEKNNVGYIKLLRGDAGFGSRKCSLNGYNERLKTEKTVDVKLVFARSKLSYSSWRKFVNHVVEVRGKYKNGRIEKAKLVRNLGR